MSSKRPTKRPRPLRRVRFETDSEADDDVFYDENPFDDSDLFDDDVSDSITFSDQPGSDQAPVTATVSKATTDAMTSTLATAEGTAALTAALAAFNAALRAPIVLAATVPSAPPWVQSAAGLSPDRVSPETEKGGNPPNKFFFEAPREDDDSDNSRAGFVERRAAAARDRLKDLGSVTSRQSAALSSAAGRKAAAVLKGLATHGSLVIPEGNQDLVVGFTAINKGGTSNEEPSRKRKPDTSGDAPRAAPAKAVMARDPLAELRAEAARLSAETQRILDANRERAERGKNRIIRDLSESDDSLDATVPRDPFADRERRRKRAELQGRFDGPFKDAAKKGALPDRLRNRDGPRNRDPLTPPKTGQKDPTRNLPPRKEPVTPTPGPPNPPKQPRKAPGGRVGAGGDPPGGDGDGDDGGGGGGGGGGGADGGDDGGDDPNRREFINRQGNIVPSRVAPRRVLPRRAIDHRFCMTVLRSMVVRFTRNQQPAGVIPTIVTPRDNTASVLCGRCRVRNKQCLTAHRAMLGDAWDMVALLNSAKECFVDRPAAPGAVDPAPSAGIIADLVLAAWHMLAAFVSADRAYRKAHNLTTDPRHQRRPNELLLLPVLEARAAQVRSLLASDLVTRDPGAAGFRTPEWQSLALLRLEEGDAGHEFWSRHREVFRSRLTRASQRWAQEPGVVSAAEALCDIPSVGGCGGQL